MSTYINNETGHTFNISKLPAPDFLKEYLNYMLAIKNLTVRTVDNYYLLLKGFLGWAHLKYIGDEINKYSIEHASIIEMKLSEIGVLTMQDLHEYLTFTKDVLDNSDASRSYRLTSIKSFYKYYNKINPLLDNNPAEDIPYPKRAKVLPKYLTKKECLQLLTTVAAGNTDNDFVNARDYCMVCMMINCGMRLSELIGINTGDISLEDNSLRLFGKGRKERIVYLNSSCIQALASYSLQRQLVLKHATNALFISDRTGDRITQRRFQQILDNQLELAGLGGREFSPHKLRHTAATLMYQSGQDVLVLKEILGHESIATTEIYTHLGNSQVREAMEHSPLAGFNKESLNISMIKNEK